MAFSPRKLLQSTASADSLPSQPAAGGQNFPRSALARPAQPTGRERSDRRPKEASRAEPGYGVSSSFPRGSCGSFPRMSDLTIEVETARSSMEEIRPALDAGLKE